MNAIDQLPTAVTIGMKADLMRSDLQRGLVWFLNYAACNPSGVTAEQLDLHNTSMLPSDVELFAHRWLAFSRSMDINHDGIGRPIRVVESFFNSESVASPMWPLNAHAMRVDASGSEEAIDGLRTGSLNSLSLDAFTFNVKKLLPVDRPTQVSRALMSSADFAGLARTVASTGFSNVQSLHKVGDGLFIALRGDLTPIGVQILDDGDIEISAAGGAWSSLGVTLASAATLVYRADDSTGGHVPNHDGVDKVDYRPWDSTNMSLVGAETGDAPVPWAYVSAEGVGVLPHHTPCGVSLMAVAQALSDLNSVPESHRSEARSHLLLHLRGLR